MVAILDRHHIEPRVRIEGGRIPVGSASHRGAALYSRPRRRICGQELDRLTGGPMWDVFGKGQCSTSDILRARSHCFCAAAKSEAGAAHFGRYEYRALLI